MKQKFFERSGRPLTTINITSKKSVIEWLKAALLFVDHPNDVKAIEFMMNEIGKCPSCIGTGKRYTNQQPHDGYKIHKDPKNRTWYMLPCPTCHGNGRILSITCASCGKDADVLLSQRHVSLCASCEEKFIKLGNIL